MGGGGWGGVVIALVEWRYRGRRLQQHLRHDYGIILPVTESCRTKEAENVTRFKRYIITCN